MGEDTKQCYHCKKYFAATREFFTKRSHKEDGLNHLCRKCEKIHRDRWRAGRGDVPDKKVAEDLIGEVWLPVPEWESEYSVSNYGRVRSERDSTYTWAGRLLVGETSKLGYRRVVLSKNNKSRRYGVHQLVTSAFLGPVPDGMEVNHIDSNPSNNNIDNLEYVTRQDNIQHAIQYGKKRIKLAPKDVLGIRTMLAGGARQVDIADKYGIANNTVSEIRTGKIWGWLK